MQPFRVIVVGFGIQGKKRKTIAGDDCVAIVDPFYPDADFQDVKEVPLDSYDAALICTPDGVKTELLTYLLSSKKHVLVEKPLLSDALGHLSHLADENSVTCYTAYNHRFEPHFVNLKQVIQSGELGKIYHCRLFYGNGTARDVRNSPWRDQGTGVLVDLGSHLLDTLLFWFGHQTFDFRLTKCHTFENKSPDHMLMCTDTPFSIDMEISLMSWRNHFTCDLIGSEGSAHIESLCKWGPSTLTIRKRKLPSGRPDERAQTLINPDPTWALEYTHFQKLCKTGTSNIENDKIIHRILNHLSTEVCV